MKNLITRAVSGAVYVGIILVLILLGGTYGFPALCCLFALAGSYELLKMTDRPKGFGTMAVLDILITTLIAGVPILWTIISPMSAVALLALAILVRMICQIYSHSKTPVDNMAKSILTYVYIGCFLATTSMLYINFDFGQWVVLAVFIMIWLNDTGAYLVGCTIGSHRLFPRISPKKSWEGFFGGLAFTVAFSIILYYLFPENIYGLSLAQMCLVGVVITAAATWGDLVESMIKRAANVKDSGNLIPGHGGILDRIDSLLFTGPALWILLTLFAE